MGKHWWLLVTALAALAALSWSLVWWGSRLLEDACEHHVGHLNGGLDD